MKAYLTLITMVLLSSCGEKSNDFEQNLSIQGKINAREQIKAEEQTHHKKAEAMENHLNKRKRFIEAISGDFFGELKVQDIDLHISIEIISTIPIEYYTRVRMLDEINYEIENLAINIKIKMESSKVQDSAVSCNIVNLKPNTKSGIITIISNECKNVFKFNLSGSEDMNNITDAKKESMRIAQKVTSGSLIYIDFLDGVFESSVSSKKHLFKMWR